MSIKNRLIYLLIFLCKKRRKAAPSSSPKLLVVSTTGLGDTLWGTPALRYLRRSFPQSSITMLTSRCGAEVLKNNPHIDQLLVFKHSFFSLLFLFFTLRKSAIDTALLFHTSQRIVLPLCALSGIPQIIGNHGMQKGLDSLLTTVIPQKKQHEIARRFDITTAAIHYHLPLTKEAPSTDPYLEIYWTPQDEHAVNLFFSRSHLLSYLPIIALHPGSKDLFKQWSPEQFITLGNLLTDRLGYHIVITGNQSEAALVSQIASRIKGAVALAGDLSIPAFACFLKKISLFITNDTGPMHLAFSVRTPTVALFSPTDPLLCGPFHLDNVKVLSRPPCCAPCLRKRCKNPFCLLQISPEETFHAAQELLHAR